MYSECNNIIYCLQDQNYFKSKVEIMNMVPKDVEFKYMSLIYYYYY